MTDYEKAVMREYDRQAEGGRRFMLVAMALMAIGVALLLLALTL